MTEEMRGKIKVAADALKKAGARDVFLFGSAARGTMREGSDIDLAVSGLPPERFFDAMGVASDVLGADIDLIDLDEDTPFTRHLKRERKLARVD